MSKLDIVKQLEATQLKQDVPHFRVGDTLRLHIRIIEGEKERIQMFTGTVIARKGAGLSETMTLYRVAFGGTVERVFVINSPRIAKIERLTVGHVRRAKLYYLLGKKGKKAKVRQKVGIKGRITPVDNSAKTADTAAS
jgi:large subunit ribosomal protein L19